MYDDAATFPGPGVVVVVGEHHGVGLAAGVGLRWLDTMFHVRFLSHVSLCLGVAKGALTDTAVFQLVNLAQV